LDRFREVAVDVGRLRFFDGFAGASESSSTTKPSISSARRQLRSRQVFRSPTIIIVSATIKASYEGILFVVIIHDWFASSLSLIREDTSRVESTFIVIIGLGVADRFLGLQRI
jgi:hypothetical protein